MKLKFWLLILTILASVSFFDPGNLIDGPIGKLLFYLSMMACLVVAVKDGVSLHGIRYPRWAYAAVLGGIVVSVIMASAFHMQTLTESVITTMPYLLAYMTFYVLMRFDIPTDRIIKAYMVLAACAAVIYFINLATMPFNIFGKPMFDAHDQRGVLRLPVVFIEFFPVLLFYVINRWLLDGKPKWILLAAGLSLLIVLSVIRQIIGLSVVLGLWFILKRADIKIKVGVIALVVAFAVFVLPRIPIYQALVEITEEQAEANEETEDVRIGAWRYYTYEHQTNGLSPIFGNGMPALGVSRWGILQEAEMDEYFAFFVDVGWAGLYWLFGAFTTIGLLTLMLVAIFRRKPPHEQFLTYSLIFLFITSFASGPPVIYWQIIDIMVVLYMVYRRPATSQPEADAPRDTLPKIPTGLYPQLNSSSKSPNDAGDRPHYPQL